MILIKQVEQGIRLALNCLLEIYGAAVILSQAQLGTATWETERRKVENFNFGQIGDLKKLVLDLHPGGKVFNSIIDAAIAGRKGEDVAILQAINRKRRKQPKNGGGKGDLSGSNMIHLLREEGKRGTALEMKNDQKEVAVSVESSPQEELQRHNFIRQKLRIISWIAISFETLLECKSYVDLKHPSTYNHWSAQLDKTDRWLRARGKGWKSFAVHSSWHALFHQKLTLIRSGSSWMVTEIPGYQRSRTLQALDQSRSNRVTEWIRQTWSDASTYVASFLPKVGKLNWAKKKQRAYVRTRRVCKRERENRLPRRRELRTTPGGRGDGDEAFELQLGTWAELDELIANLFNLRLAKRRRSLNQSWAL